MRNEINIEVPGKCMIAGEYGVLAPGGSAIAFAVAPGLLVHAKASSRWGIKRTDMEVSWNEGEEPDQELLFAHQALLHGQSMLPDNIAPVSFTIAPASKGMSGSKKAGLGGSAATVIGILKSLFQHAGFVPDDAAFLNAALSIHQGAQNGRGSGYDIATIATGGLVYWSPETRIAQTLTWPEGLHCLSGFSGRSAHTPTLIKASESAEQLGPLQNATERLAGAFQEGESDNILSSIAHCQQVFLDWNDRYELGLWTEELNILSRTASELGAVTRVSGAGGGDTLLAFSTNPDLLDALARAWGEAGFDSDLRRPSTSTPPALT